MAGIERPGLTNVRKGDGETGPGEPGGPHALVGPSHTASGLTAGQMLRATGPTSFAFGAVQEGDLPASMATEAEVAAALGAHEGASDPHPGYLQDGERGAANGVAPLDGASHVPAANLPAASEAGAGIVELAADGEAAAGLAVQGNDGRLSDTRPPDLHHATHQHGGDDEVATATPGANAIPKAGSGGTLDAGWLPAGMATDAELAGAISSHEGAGDPHPGYQLESGKGTAGGYAGLDGGAKVPTGNLPAATTTAAGTVELATDGEAGASLAVQANDGRLSNARTPTAHGASHAGGAGDPLKLDDLGTPDDNTDLNASTTRHGLLAKLSGSTAQFLRGDGAWAAPPGGGGGLSHPEVMSRLAIGF